jgi:hypothetical protein
MAPDVSDREADYHLHLEPDEARVAATALRLLISDEAHEALIRGLARGVLGRLSEAPTADKPLTLALSEPEMKITHTGVKLLLDDLQREQADERRILWQIIEKLPDEHAIRAIVLK